MNIDTLVCGRWVIPVEPDNTIYEHHAVAINNGRIIDLLPIDQALTRYNSLDVQHLQSHVLIPGLINAHTHSPMSLFRGIANDISLMDWLNNHIWPAEQQWVNPEFTADGTRLAIAEMIRSGTTCFSDMYYFPDTTAEVAMESGMRVIIGLIIIDFPTPWATEVDEYFAKGEQVHDKYKHIPLIRTAFAPHAPYTVSDHSLEKIATLAEELDIPIHMHVHETDNEIRQSIEQHGKRPLQRLETLGLLSNRLNAVHMTHLEPAEYALVSNYGVNVIHCPESNLKLASGFCPVRELQEAGINIALGTDGAASNNDLDMIGEMRTAALLGKGLNNDPRVLPAHNILKMATLNGARALGIDDITGSIGRGKEADIVAINMDTPATQPVYDAAAQIVYAACRDQVSDVWIGGRQVLSNGQLMTINEEQMLHKTRTWQTRLATIPPA